MKIKIFLLMFLIAVPMTFLSYNTVILNISRSNRQISEDLLVAKKEQPKQALSMKWTANGTAICTEIQKQENIDVFSDGAKGAAIVWEDNRDGEKDIYGLRISSSGNKYGDNNGTVICNAPNDQFTPKGVANITSGSIIVWADNRTGELDIYAQRIDTEGNMVWGDNGTVICNATGDQLDPQICEDGLGGAIITWEDNRTGELDIYVQRIDQSKNKLWTNNGTVICNATKEQENPQIISDGFGGAIVTWQDKRTIDLKFFVYLFDIYALRINKDGNKVAGWLYNGTVICNATGEQKDPQLCLYNSGGAFITWMDIRGGFDYDIYVQVIGSDGKTLLVGNGTVICNATNYQTQPYIVSSDLTSAIVSWEDKRNGATLDIYAQKINSNGETLWDDNGTVICNAESHQMDPRICGDGYGGAVITWTDMRTGATMDIYAQRINSNGVTLWGVNGTVICNSGQYPELCSNGAGGAIIAWEDLRDLVATLYDIYAQNVGVKTGGGIIPGAGDDDDDDDDEVAISAGNYFLISAVIGVIFLIIIMKRKLLFRKQ